MKNQIEICTLVALLVLIGCGNSDSKDDKAPESSPDQFSDVSPPSPNFSPTPSPAGGWVIPDPPVNPQCPGKRIGVYSWDTTYWRSGNPQLLDFLDSKSGREWSCGDTYVNIADYTSANSIPDQDNLVQFAKTFRKRVANSRAVLYFTYGDVTARDGKAMIAFTETFFKWIRSISSADAKQMGTIGISYDVEHMSIDDTRAVLNMCREQRKSTHFGETDLKIQWTVEGDRNIVGTDLAFKLADSALVMLYSNYIESPVYPRDQSLYSRLRWLLSEQCEKCLDDEYAQAQYRAKITVMVEASCEMGRSCAWASFCAYDWPDEGARYLSRTLETAMNMLARNGDISPSQYERLFNIDSPYAVHSFEWYRCSAPFSGLFTYPNCARYHTLANACRAQ